jgi:hypothetical protein
MLASIASGDPVGSNSFATELLKIHSPAVLYERVSKAAMTLYSIGLGATKIPSWWNTEQVQQVSVLGTLLVGIARRFAARPGRVSNATFLCDVATSTQEVLQPISTITAVPQVQTPRVGPTKKGDSDGRIYKPVEFQTSPVVVSGSYLDPRGVNKSKVGCSEADRTATATTVRSLDRLSPSAFSDLVSQRLLELRGENGPKGQDNMGDS